MRPHLERLQEASGNVATLGIRDDDARIYIDKFEPTDFEIRLHSEIGKRFPLHCTATGKVLLAHGDATTTARVTRRELQQYTANTIIDGKALRRELESVARRGYAVDREEITRGLVCVAAPVYGPDEEIAAAFSCTIPSFEASTDGLAVITELVQQCAHAASG